MSVIGLLNGGSPGPLRDQLAGFHQALKERGYIEGQNLAIKISLGGRSIRSTAGAVGGAGAPSGDGDVAVARAYM
jgi:hypothetical protein